MEWLNYHHLRYFCVVATEGSLARAAEKLRVSQLSISGQIRELEGALGEKLFQREGRKNKLTDAGQVVFGYAEEIFSLGRELMNAVKQRPGAKSLRLHVGILDSFPKLVTSRILQPAFALPQSVSVVCREGKMDELLAQLAVHRLDIVLADEPAPNSTGFKIYDHPLGRSETVFCASQKLAKQLKSGFPKSLNEAPLLLPAQNTSLRRSLENWFREHDLRPRVVAECDDLALLKPWRQRVAASLPFPKWPWTMRWGNTVFANLEGPAAATSSFTPSRQSDGSPILASRQSPKPLQR